MKRSGKFYRRNEEEVMKALGLNPTKNSGSGWVEKEDGQSENVICQLKSTDANSIRVLKQDIDTLEYNAAVAHKIPVFAIQFLSTQETYLLVKPEVMKDLVEYINTGEYESKNQFLGLEDDNITQGNQEEIIPRRIIKSSSSAREQFRREQEKKFKKARKSAK